MVRMIHRVCGGRRARYVVAVMAAVILISCCYSLLLPVVFLGYRDFFTTKSVSQRTVRIRAIIQDNPQDPVQPRANCCTTERRNRADGSGKEAQTIRTAGAREDDERTARDDLTFGDTIQSNAENSGDGLMAGEMEQSDKRLDLASSVCRVSQIAGSVDKVYVYEAQKVAYCSVHKIASTYWIRIFRWLYNDTSSGHVSSPLLISKFDTHLLPFKKLKTRSQHDKEDKALVEASYRFLFTRDPYTRLWSVYIDKFVLPDNYFWSFYAPKIKYSVYGKMSKMPVATRTQYKHGVKSSTDGTVQINRGPHWINITHMHDGQGLKSNTFSDTTPFHHPHHVDTRRKAFCPEVTFHEFLQYIVNVATKATGRSLDEHVRPVHYGCNPCTFRPHFIGHAETMREDSAQVLRQMKLNLPEMESNHVEQEIDTLTDFNFELVVKKGLQKFCVSPFDLERRLLKAFVYNGYVPTDRESWLERQLPLGQAKFKEAVLNLYHESEHTSHSVRQHRERYKSEAFHQIPRDLLLAVQKIYRWDFELFGYDPSPPEIFDRI